MQVTCSIHDQHTVDVGKLPHNDDALVPSCHRDSVRSLTASFVAAIGYSGLIRT